MWKFWSRIAAFARICAMGMVALGVLVMALLVWRPQILMHGVYVLAVLGVMAVCVTMTTGAVQMLLK